MTAINSEPDEYDLNIDGGTHTVLRFVSGHVGGDTIEIGTAGKCRYCGNEDPKLFRKIAHTFPEGLGSKWLLSRDECDQCNAAFAPYDDALVKSIGSVLTIGGTKGKGNAVRQTGRSQGSHIRQGRNAEGRRQITMKANVENFDGHFGVNLSTGKLQAKMPIPPERFIPLFAYRALVKMGLALMPVVELAHFTKLRKWLLFPIDDGPIPQMNVGLSFGSLGNAPAIASAALLKRSAPQQHQPYMLFIASIGSVCFQLDLKSDEQDGTWPPQRETRCGIRWQNVISGGEGDDREPIAIRYGNTVQLDWSGTELTSSPIEALTLTFDPATLEGRFRPVFRSDALLP